MPAETIDVQSLPAPARERVTACMNGRDASIPVLALLVPQRAHLGWFALSAAGLAAAVLFFLRDVSWYEGSGVFAGLIMVYALTITAFLSGIVLGVRALWRRKTAPFPPGYYAFPLDFVDARTSALVVTPLSDLRNIELVGSRAVLSFSDQGAKELTALVPGRTGEVYRALVQAREAVQSAREGRDASAGFRSPDEQLRRLLERFDPFASCRTADLGIEIPGPASALARAAIHGSGAAERGQWKGTLLAVAASAAVSAGLTVPVWQLRCRIGEERAFAEAKRVSTVEAYERYLTIGARHQDEVTRTLIPRAAYEAAKSVAALRSVRARYPGTEVAEQAKADIHAAYEKALALFRTKSSSTYPAVLPFMEQLVAHLEARESPYVLLWFTPSSTLADDEQSLVHADDLPATVLASPYFDGGNIGPLERGMASALEDTFKSTFPPDLLSIDGAWDPPPPGTAFIEVGYSTSILRGEKGGYGVYESEKSKRRFLKVLFRFDVRLVTPKVDPRSACSPGAEASERRSGACELHFAFEIKPPPAFTVEYTYKNPQLQREPPGASEDQVYAVMAGRAFDEISGRLQGLFFREGP